MTILEALTGTNINNRRTRGELMQMTDKSDRTVRVQIAKLRRQRHLILSDTSKAGYWLGTPQEWDILFCNKQRRRGLSNLYAKTNEIEGQLKIVWEEI